MAPEDYPELEPEDLQAVFAFAGDLVSETRLYQVAGQAWRQVFFVSIPRCLHT